jgi:cell division septation protein DedD
VQLIAYGTIQKALSFADRLNKEDKIGAFVTPVPLGRRTVWYRVLTGPYPTRDSAEAARAELWRRSIVPDGQGDVLRAPYTLELAPSTDVARLRRDGVPAVPQTGEGPVRVGAFETADQASLAQARLKHAGMKAVLVQRVDTVP